MPPLNINVLDIIGSANAPTFASNTVQLSPGETVEFKTSDGKTAKIKTDMLKLTRLGTINSERSTADVTNLQMRFVFKGTILNEQDKVHPYLALNGMDQLVFQILGQLWQASPTAVQKLYNHLGEKYNWRIRKNVRREGQANGLLVEARPPQPMTDANGQPDFTNFGVPVSRVNVASTYNPERQMYGFRDFYTELSDSHNELVVIDGIEDAGAKDSALSDWRRHALFLTGGKNDHFPRTAQINSLFVPDLQLDLWGTGGQISLNDLISKKATPAAGTASSTTPQISAENEEPF